MFFKDVCKTCFEESGPSTRLPSVMSARLVSTLPSMNLITARMMQTRLLMMDTLNRKSSWKGQMERRLRYFVDAFIHCSVLASLRVSTWVPFKFLLFIKI